jgi:tetratricopeptide (TPR) repeat protein
MSVATQSRSSFAVRAAFSAAGILILLAPTPAASQTVRQMTEQCGNGSDLDAVIRSCSGLIERGNVAARELSIIFNNRGVAYSQLGNFDKAVADYSEAIRLDPSAESSYTDRGITYNKMDLFDLAIADFNAAIRLNGQAAEAYASRGFSYKEKRNYGQAIADLNEAIRLNPNNAVSYANRASAYINLENYDQAIIDLTASIKLNPHNAVVFSNRGYAYTIKREFDRATSDFKAALLLDPSFTDARNGLKLVEAQRKKYQGSSQPTPMEPNSTPTNPTFLTPQEGNNGAGPHFGPQDLEDLLSPLPPHPGILRNPYNNPDPK